MIVWTEQAGRQLELAYDYIALSNSSGIAAGVVNRILSAVERLAHYPLSGRSGRVSDTRELVVPGTPFVIAYAVQKTRIVVLAIFHGAQRWPEDL